MSAASLRVPPLLELERALTLRSGFVSSAAAHANSTALVIGERAWSYAEADDIVRRWATRLGDAASGRPARVGVFGSRSEASYLGVLAAMYAGATFVPLNPRFPADRTRAMLEQAEVDVVIADATSLKALAEILGHMARPPRVISPDVEVSASPCALAFGKSELARALPLGELPVISPDDDAYLLFTSGSTGKPKGVPIAHRNATAFLDYNQRRYRLTSADRLSQTFDQTFDLSIFDLFMAWGAGAAVCALQPIQLLAPFRFLEQQRVTVWFSVPSVAALMQRQGTLRPGSLPTLRWSLFCGEALPASTAEAWQAAAPQSVVENLYGPTELTIACAAYRWDPMRSPGECVQGLVPIGRVYDGLRPLIVDAQLQPVRGGETGELCVAGAQTFAGYWRAPQLTAERVFEHGGARYYRTGDLVRETADGVLAYLGRGDHQVKIGGYRIELGEIEAVLRHAGCVEAAALAHPAASPEGIVAFVAGEVDVAAVEAALRQQLPSYMVPRAIQVVDEMPLNANGKVDRAALRQRLSSNASLPG